jgi:BASS family bile acid:Na+ symporter
VNAEFIKSVVMVSVMFLMLGVGLKTTIRSVIDVARQVGLVTRGVVANFVVIPVLICLSLIWLPLAMEVKIGILLMAAAPIAPMAPPFVGMARGDVPYAVGLMVIVALLSVGLTPVILILAMPASTGGVDLNPLQIVKILHIAQLIPIGVGMGIRHVSPSSADKLFEFVAKIGQLGLIVGVSLILATQARQILSIGLLPHLVIVFWLVASLFVGDWMLIGEASELRRALAVSTAIRNVPLALLIAGENFPGTVVAPVVVVYGTYSMVVSIGYGRLMDRRDI